MVYPSSDVCCLTHTAETAINAWQKILLRILHHANSSVTCYMYGYTNYLKSISILSLIEIKIDGDRQIDKQTYKTSTLSITAFWFFNMIIISTHNMYTSNHCRQFPVFVTMCTHSLVWIICISPLIFKTYRNAISGITP